MGLCNTGFSNTVNYTQKIQDHGWFAKAESFANTLRAPVRWVAAELCNGGKTYQVILLDGEVQREKVGTPLAETTLGKIARVAVGAILAVPGYLLSIPFMSTAFVNEEIRLKHAFTVRTLTPEEKKQLETLIKERTALPAEKQKEPISCLLCSMCLMLCCIVCSASSA